MQSCPWLELVTQYSHGDDAIRGTHIQQTGPLLQFGFVGESQICEFSMLPPADPSIIRLAQQAQHASVLIPLVSRQAATTAEHRERG